MFDLKLKAAKGGFFDREPVRRAVDAAALRILSRFGAYVRQRARTSIRVRGGTSAPGSPPHGHISGTRTRSDRAGRTRVRPVSLLREWILFSYDRERKSVIVGPAKLAGTVGPRALEALEYGGTTIALTNGKKRSLTVRARPFMRPAFSEELSRLPEDWRNAVR